MAEMVERTPYATSVEPYIKEWYDYLWDGKLMGVRCKNCGEIGFPPFPVCNGCHHTDMEWVEVSGEGQLLAFTQYTAGVLPFKMEPVIVGFVQLKEGSIFMSWVEDAPQDLAEQEAFNRTLPVPVTMSVKVMDPENRIAYPVFNLKKD